MEFCLSESLAAAHDQKGHDAGIDQVQQIKRQIDVVQNIDQENRRAHRPI